jgi:hypothetical protein
MYFKIYVKRVQNDISDLLDYDKLHIVNLNND